MPLPDSLYYRKKELKRQYTSQPTGKLDVGRALDNNPRCWRKVDLESKNQPKTIVINDFRLYELQEDDDDFSKIRHYEDTIARLLSKGFDVYLWLEDGPLAITYDNINVLRIEYYQQKLKATSPKEIVKQLSERQIPADAIQLVNFSDLRQLTLALHDMPHDYQPNQEVDVASINKDTVHDILKAFPKASFLSYQTTDSRLKEKTETGRRILEDVKGSNVFVAEQNHHTINPMMGSAYDSRDDIFERYYEDAQEPQLGFSGIGAYSLPMDLSEAREIDYTKLPSGADWLDKLHIMFGQNVKIDDLCELLPDFRVLRELHLFGASFQLPGKSELTKLIESGTLAPLSQVNRLELMEGTYFSDAKGNVLGGAELGDMLSDIFGSLQHLKIASCPEIDGLECFRHVANHHQLRAVHIEEDAIRPATKLKLSDFLKTPILSQFYWDGKPSEQGMELEIEDDLEEGQDFVLENLIELHLPKHIPINGIEKLLRRAPNLKKLSLCWPRNVNRDMTIQGVEDIELYLKVPEDVFTIGEYHSFGAQVLAEKNVKHLAIHAEKQIDDPFKTLDNAISVIGNEPLPLETITCTGTDICRRLGGLLMGFDSHYAANLKKLELFQSNNSLLKHFEEYPDLNLESLTVESYEAIDLNRGDTYLQVYQLMKKFGLKKCCFMHLLDRDDPKQRNYMWLNLDSIEKTIANKYGTSALSRQITLTDPMAQRQRVANSPPVLDASSHMHLGSSKNTITLDADTGEPDEPFQAVKIFKGLNARDPDVAEYRLSFFNELKITSKEAPFELTFNGNETCRVISNYAYGQEAVDSFSADNLTSPVMKGTVNVMISDQWTMLPSLQANETLINLYIEGFERHEIEIGYNPEKHMYAVRKKTPGSVATLCHMNLLCPTPQKAPRNEAIDSLVQFFNSFKNEALDLSGLPDNPSGDDLLKAIIGQKRGVCRHRSVAFFHQAAETIPDVQVNIITNDVHVYVELELDGQAYKYDLGGAPGNIQYHEPEAIVRKIQKQNRQLAPPGSKAAMMPADKDFELDARHTTWKQDKSQSAKAVCLEAISQVEKDSQTGQNHGHNVLIQCKDDASANLIALQLQHDATHTARPVFVIDSPDLVSCARRRMQRLPDGTGRPMEGGGPLYDFLTQDFQEGDRPVLIVNWNLLNPEDVVRLNSLIDEHRSADGTDIPREMVVVGVYNTKSPDAYKGSDFYSRNEIKYTIPVDHDLDGSAFELEVAELESEVSELVTIELYNSDDWKEMLLGQWVIDEGKVVFKQGPLLDALEAGKGVHLANAPWDNPDFKRFWQQLKISGELEAYDRKYKVPENFWGSLRQSKGYDWTAFNHVAFVETASDLNQPLVLGGATLAEFTLHTKVEHSKPLLAQSEFTEYAGKRIDLIVTESHPWQVWHQLLSEAQKHQVKVNLAVPEGIDLPGEFKAFATVKRLQRPLAPKVDVVHSTDPDFSVLKLRQDAATKPPVVIDLSDMATENVFFDCALDIDKLTIETSFSDVWVLINSGQDVILKGSFTAEVAQHLQTIALEQSLHVNGQPMPFTGKLTIVSDATLSPAIAAKIDEPTVSEKVQWLLDSHQDTWDESLVKAIQSHPWPEDITVEQMKASIAYYQRSTPPSFDYLAPIQKEIKIKLDPELLSDPEQLQRRHMEVLNKRFQDINTVLTSAPFVFIAGPTGVGKSTFVDNYLTQEMGYAVHHGLNHLKDWANDKTSGLTKVLFIDEANISTENYRMFEGLYEDPPFIIIEGDKIALDDEHKVIFAGNPMSYGGERNLPSLITRHGNICTFEPLPPATIQLEMIEPILSETIKELNLQTRVSEAILKAYVEICQYSQTEVLVSPRELKMMAMMIATSDNPTAEYEAIVYKVAAQALPQRYHARFANWAKEHMPAHAHQAKVEPKSPEDSTFILTDSRKPIYQTLGQMLNVRENLVLNPNSKVSAAGLGGMLLEGEPGTGKSHFYIDALRDYGYEQVSLDTMQTDKSKAFVFIPASMDFEQKAEKLVEAFEQGLIVVTDEINSGPALEQLLNSLLMGQHPDKTKDPSTIKPGFQLLGTQNPISMGHRQATSGAIARRMMKFDFNAYTNDEMIQILKARFPLLTDKTIEKHVRLHVEHREYATTHDKEPMPVFRDLIKLMENQHHAKLSNMVSAGQTKGSKAGVFAARQMVRDLKRQVQTTKVEDKSSPNAPSQTKAKKQRT